MTAPDTYIQQEDVGTGQVRQVARQRTAEELTAAFMGTISRLHQSDGATWPVPIFMEHPYPGALSLGAVETVAMVEMDGGKLGIEATMLLEDENLAKRLTEGTLWTSPAVIHGGMLGIDGQIGDYIEHLALVSEPAQRDYRARELLSARTNRLAPERATYQEASMAETQTVIATVESLSTRIGQLTAEREELAKALEKEKLERGVLETKLKDMEVKVQEAELETLSKQLVEKGLVKGEVESVIAQIKRHPEDRAEIVATAELLAARLPQDPNRPTVSTVPGEPAPDAKTRIQNAEHVVEAWAAEKRGVK
jgi:hypothetical protein